MHELSLLNDLLKKIRQIAQEQHPASIQSVNIELGALAHISADHFREHFEQAVAGTELATVTLHVAVNNDIHAPTAQDILLRSVDLVEHHD